MAEEGPDWDLFTQAAAEPSVCFKEDANDNKYNSNSKIYHSNDSNNNNDDNDGSSAMTMNMEDTKDDRMNNITNILENLSHGSRFNAIKNNNDINNINSNNDNDIDIYENFTFEDRGVFCDILKQLK